MKKISIIILVASFFVSCSQKITNYGYSLNKAEVGGKQVVVNKDNYSDEDMDIQFKVLDQEVDFTIKNKTSQNIKIIWDEVVYVNTEGMAGKMFHAGVKYDKRYEEQVSTNVPKGAMMTERLIPSDNVYHVNRFSTLKPVWTPESEFWGFKFLLETKGKKSFLKTESPKNIGKTIQVQLPLEVNGEKNFYIFTFEIKEVKGYSKYRRLE